MCNDLEKEIRRGRGDTLDLGDEVKTLRQRHETASQCRMMECMTIAALGKQLDCLALLVAGQQQTMQCQELQLSQISNKVDRVLKLLASGSGGRANSKQPPEINMDAICDDRPAPPKKPKPVSEVQEQPVELVQSSKPFLGTVAANRTMKRQHKAMTVAAAQKRQRIEEGDPLSPLIKPSGGVRIVYPGQDGVPFWANKWEGKVGSIAKYPSLVAVWDEWETGIPYKALRLQTVPLARMEEDLACGRAKWRESKTIRNRMAEMKPVLYYAMDQAQQKCCSPKTFLLKFEEMLKADSGQSQKALFTLAQDHVRSTGFMKPKEYEAKVLNWAAHTGKGTAESA